MKKIYPDAVKDFPPNSLPTIGNLIQVNYFIDSDHACDKIRRLSRYGITLYCNKFPIFQYYKRQANVNISTFGSEFVALQVASELILSLRYKLWMFGIPILGHADVFCDNEAV